MYLNLYRARFLYHLTISRMGVATVLISMDPMEED
jgi:hypothetical protein